MHDLVGIVPTAAATAVATAILQLKPGCQEGQGCLSIPGPGMLSRQAFADPLSIPETRPKSEIPEISSV